MAASLKVRKDDTVRIIAGKDKGKTGRVLRVDPRKDRVYVEHLNMVKRHQRPRQTATGMAAGGVIEQEGPIHVSNVMLIDPESGEPTRLGVKRDGGRRVRVAKKSGKEIE